MDITEIFKITGAILSSIIGSTVIIIGLSSWLGKVWANRVLEQDKLKYALELEKIKNRIQSESEKQNVMFSLYFEGQFKIYNDLWVSLVELQNWVDILWSEANPRNLRMFISVLKKAKRQIRNSALLIETNHYNEIMLVIDSLENYQVGKEGLINYVNNIENSSEQEMNIRKIIEQNSESRIKINIFVDRIFKSMRDKIRSTN